LKMGKNWPFFVWGPFSEAIFRPSKPAFLIFTHGK